MNRMNGRNAPWISRLAGCLLVAAVFSPARVAWGQLAAQEIQITSSTATESTPTLGADARRGGL